jgi:hypothetical protein
MIQETEFRVANEKGYNSYLCPCRSCHGGHRYSLQTIRAHLRLNKRDEMLNFSMVGGDPPGGYPRDGVCVNAGDDEFVDAQNVFDDEYEGTQYAKHLDPCHDVHMPSMLGTAFVRALRTGKTLTMARTLRGTKSVKSWNSLRICTCTPPNLYTRDSM